MFGKQFKVLVENMAVVYRPIGKFEIFYAHEKDGMLEYEIIDNAFGQPSPANWDTSSYAQMMRSIVEDYLQNMIDENIIELLED